MAPALKNLDTPSKKANAAIKSSTSKSSSNNGTKRSPVKNVPLKKSTDRMSKPSIPITKQPSAKKAAELTKAINAAEPTKPAQRSRTSKSTTGTERLDRECSELPEMPINNALPTLAQGPETYLHRLPGELRNRIYRYIGLRGSRIQLASHKEPALATAIPDLRDEIHSIFFAENALQVSVYSDFKVHDSEPQSYRVAPRGGRFGAGNIAIDHGSWVLRSNADVVRIRRISFSVHEMGGYPIADFFVNVRRDKETGGSLVRAALHVKGTTKRLTRQNMNPMAEMAKHFSKKEGGKAGFVGFTWAQIKSIGASFENVKTAKEMLEMKEKRERREEKTRLQKQAQAGPPLK